MSLSDRLTEVEARLAQATKGPWEFHEGGDAPAVKAIQAGGHQRQHILYPAGLAAYDDARLAAHAPTDLALLTAALRRCVGALDWYAERAEALQRYVSVKPPKPDAMLAVVTELALDNGARHRAALADLDRLAGKD